MNKRKMAMLFFKNYQQGNYYYGFAGNDSNLHNNSFNNGYTVGDNVQEGRNRDSYWKYMCVYGNTGHSSYAGYVPYVGVTWKDISRGTSSYKSHTTLSAC